MFPFPTRKERPLLGMTGYGGGAGGLSAGGAAGGFEATGGTTAEYTDPTGSWKSHKFVVGDNGTPTGSFVVSSAGDGIEYLIVGGGGGGGASGTGGFHGAGGGEGGCASVFLSGICMALSLATSMASLSIIIHHPSTCGLSRAAFD